MLGALLCSILGGDVTAYKLKVFVSGTGRPVILLHGIVSTHRYWRDVVKQLEPDYTVHAVDLLGFGDSPKPRTAAYDLDEQLGSLKATFDQSQFVKKPVLVGHSMGAVIAAHWAVAEPERFAGIVLISPVLLHKRRLHEQLAAIAVGGGRKLPRWLAIFLVGTMRFIGIMPLSITKRILSRDFPPHVVEDITRQRYYVFRRLLAHAHYGDDVLRVVGQLRLATRIVMGTDDVTVNHALTDVEALCRERTGCQIEVVQGGHQIPLEHPDAVTRVIRSLT